MYKNGVLQGIHAYHISTLLEEETSTQFLIISNWLMPLLKPKYVSEARQETSKRASLIYCILRILYATHRRLHITLSCVCHAAFNTFQILISHHSKIEGAT